MNPNVPLVFVDTETTGLSYEKQVFDIAMIRVNPDGTEERDQFFIPIVDEDIKGYEYDKVAEQFNHIERYHPDKAITVVNAVMRIDRMFRDRAHFVGMVPDFDANALWKLIRSINGERSGFPWYYQLIDVDNMAHGFLIAYARHAVLMENEELIDMWRGLAALPIDTDKLSKVLEVAVPDDSIRHTAMGDAEWTKNIYFALTDITAP